MKYFLLTLIIIITACSPKLTRFNYKEPPKKNNQDCEANFIFQNTDFSGFELLGKAEFDDTGFNINCSLVEILELFRQEACNLGANIIYVHDILKPGARSTCFRAKADFYNGNNDSLKIYLAKKDEKTDTTQSKINNKDQNTIIQGNNLSGEFGIGALFSGSRYTLVKEGLNPQPDNLTIMCFGIGNTYYHDKIGFELKFNYLMTKAGKEDYEPLYVYNDYIFSGGLVLVIAQRHDLGNSTKFEIRGGFNYDIFSFDSELYLDELGKANGLGFYLNLGVNFINISHGNNFGFCLEYNYLNARYSGAQQSFDANNLIFYIKLGLVIL